MKTLQNYVSTLSHSAGICLYHFVFVCKYRRSYITETLSRDLRLYLYHAAEELKVTIETLEFGYDGENQTEFNHVHLLINAPQTLSPSKIASSIKARTKFYLGKGYPEFKDIDFWKTGYFVSTVSLGNNLEATRAYIEGQTKH